jgi:hypothetical protein
MFGYRVMRGFREKADFFKWMLFALVLVGIVVLIKGPLHGFTLEFGPAENALQEYRGVRYENVYTRVPTKGKLANIRIADNGRIFYICREGAGFAVYHLEVRPMEGFRSVMEDEFKKAGKKWDEVMPDDLLLTQDRMDYEVRKQIRKYSEAVWVRNEIVVEEERAAKKGD